MTKKRSTQQRVLSFGRGGWRPGAGRPRSKRSNKIVLHRKRPDISPRYPLHIVLKVRPELSNLRTKKRVQVIRAAFAAAVGTDGFRIIDWSIQRLHIHLIVEADSNSELARGMQGFCVRISRGLNRLAGRKGSVFAERYHVQSLRTPTEVRWARAYVINNDRRHAAQSGRLLDKDWVDPYSSWASFDGWRDLPRDLIRLAAEEHAEPATTAQPRSWLLRLGWRRCGLVSVSETPGLRRTCSP